MKTIANPTDPQCPPEPHSQALGLAAFHAALRASEEGLRTNEKLVALIRAAPLAIMALDPDGHVTMWNPAAERMFGWTEQEVLGHPLPIVPEDKQAEYQALLGKALRGEPLASVEILRRRKNGSPIEVSLSTAPLRNSSGEIYGVMALIQDITPQKQSAQMLAQLAAIVESSDNSIISTTPDGTILTWNAGAERVYGYQAREMQGRRIWELFAPGRLQVDLHALESTRRGARVEHLETVHLRRDGKPIQILLTISPIRDEAGRITGAAHIAWDITERKTMERQLAQAQKMESIGQLAAGIAHEINTPIQYVGDNIRFLQSSFQTLAALWEENTRGVDLAYLRREVPKAIEQALEGVESVAAIVRAMKEFSHPGRGEKIAIHINHAIESLILVSRNEWKYVAEVATDFDANLPPVRCLPGEFNQVILNLLVNAAHAIADAVRDRDGQKGLIAITTRRDGDWAEIRVRDTGTGIAESVRPHVFNPFFTTKEAGKGTGQGLAIVHAVVVQRHGGAITFDTRVGEGTTFIVRLPIDGAKQ